jgi:hypothetical protein
VKFAIVDFHLGDKSDWIADHSCSVLRKLQRIAVEATLRMNHVFVLESKFAETSVHATEEA